MLADALNQPTLQKQIQSLEFAVKAGADINQKINNESALKRINNYEEDFVPLAATIFKLGAKVDDEEYQGGSPLHDALQYEGSTFKKVNAIWIYTKFGVNVNHVNEEWATPLDYARYFSSNKKGEYEIIFALRMRGAVHGFGYYSPDRSLPIFSKPASAMAITMTGSVALFKRIVV